MEVVKEDRGHGYRVELPDGTYTYLSNADASRLYDNLRLALHDSNFTRPA